MANQTGALRFTVEERVLLHLLDYITARSKIEVPQSITQEGISQIIHIHRKHLPRCLKIMKEKTLIQEKTTHVIGKTQRMKTYYLTLTGEARACELRDCILNCTIQIRDTHDCLKKITIKEVKNFVQGLQSVAEIISCINSDGIIDLNQTEIKQPKQEKQTNRLDIYKQSLKQAWKDGKMTADERDLLKNLRISLSISEKEHIRLEGEILKEAATTTDAKVVEVYNVALRQALADNRISADERAILQKIKKHFNIK